MKPRFALGDRVVTSRTLAWPAGATGVIATAPMAVTAVSGQWPNEVARREVWPEGEVTVYWVEFDEPQPDSSGDGPYDAGSVDEESLSLISG